MKSKRQLTVPQKFKDSIHNINNSVSFCTSSFFIMFSQRSKEDYVIQISKSIFVTNFPDNFGSRDLWKICEGYGKVVDVFILNRKSKAGKRFAFVKFIRVENIDRLVGNLYTIWIGRLHLHA
ncbi:RNA-directed DNA polymerase, eukaryota, nucleotide-binding alpha-beta plait domain protein, partial [Tanacetum coccineum]